MIKDVTDLKVYQIAMELLENCTIFLERVPSSEYDSVKQSKRCAKSIVANLAEGFAKRFYPLEFKRFTLIALGSGDELVTHIRTICIAAPRLAVKGMVFQEKYIELSKRLNSLHKKWDANNYKKLKK